MAATAETVEATGEWQPTACVLCACNCGIEVQVAEGNSSAYPRRRPARSPR